MTVDVTQLKTEISVEEYIGHATCYIAGSPLENDVLSDLCREVRDLGRPSSVSFGDEVPFCILDED